MNEEINDKEKLVKKMLKEKNTKDNELHENIRVCEEALEKDRWKNQNLLAKYGQLLRKNGEQLKFIEVCRNYVKQYKITYNVLNSILCWCIYDEYIKNYDENDLEGFDEFLKEANYICDNTIQLSADEYYKNPYVITIIKVVKVYNNKNNVNYNKIIEWLDLLNPDILSEVTYEYEDEKGVHREMASHKEFYYQNKIKALEKTFRYEECYQVCEECFEKIKKFHYGNDVWIESRKLFCKCMKDSSYIDEYMKFAERNNLWHIYKKVCEICFRFNKIEDAIIYGCKAIRCSYEHEKMVNLFFSLGQLFEQIGETISAKEMFQASACYRNIYGWKISEELEYAVQKFRIDIKSKVDRRKLEAVAFEYLKRKNVLKRGTIIKIHNSSTYGFIKIGNEDIYFKMKDSKERNLRKNDVVEFEIIEIEGKKKAVNIKRCERGRKNGNIYKSR